MTKHVFDAPTYADQCQVCKAHGPCLTTECPGHVINDKLLDAICAGLIDYRDGDWVNGPALIKREKAA